MKRVSTYLKMRVLGVIDYEDGKSRRERIKKVSEMKFRDEDGSQQPPPEVGAWGAPIRGFFY